MSEQIIQGTKTIIQMRTMYGVCRETWLKWISRIPDLDLIPGQRTYTPAQVSKIISHLGHP